MKKLIIAFVMATLPAFAMASGGVHLDKAPVNLHDQASLQRGAKVFVNYCLSCHSAQYMRYNRMGKDLGLTDEQVKNNLMFAGEKVGETMTIAMASTDAKTWFGNPPPDLSVISRARGADWLYTYLRTFHADEKRPFGVNNKVFPDVGMPHVLWQQQATMTESEYDSMVGDLVNFMVYMGEPVQLQRQALGIKVLIFLAFFFVLAYLLKKEYWKDIH